MVFFLSGFFLTDDSQDSKGREGTTFYSTLRLPPAHEHWDIYFQLCMWDDSHVFLTATLVFTRLLVDEIYHLIEFSFEWLIDDAMFVCLPDELILGFLLQRLDMGNRWIWTGIDYHPCITSELTNQLCRGIRTMSEVYLEPIRRIQTEVYLEHSTTTYRSRTPLSDCFCAFN